MTTQQLDPGLELVKSAFSSLEGTAANAVKGERGFVWENGGIPQSVWAEEPVEDDGFLVSRVHAETLFLSGAPDTPAAQTLLARYAGFAGLGGPVRTPDGSVSLKTTVFAHRGNLDSTRQLFAAALAAGAVESCAMSAAVAEDAGGAPAGPPDPFESARPELRAGMERSCRLIPISRSGQRPWNDEAFYLFVKEFIGPRSLQTSAAKDGLTAEYPFGRESGPAGTGGLSILFRLLGSLTHPLLGDGIKLVLVLPEPLPGPEGAEMVLGLNGLEQREWTRCNFLGSWHLDPAGFPTFSGFLPAAFCNPAVILNQVAIFGIRAAWVANLGARDNSPSHPRERSQW